MSASPKYRLTQAQLRALIVDQRSAFDGMGRTILVAGAEAAKEAVAIEKEAGQ